LNNVVFAEDKRGEIDFQSGSNAIIFKLFVDGVKCAMKCYMTTAPGQEERQGRVIDYLNSLNSSLFDSSCRLLRDELYVYDGLGNGSYHSALLRPWTEGVTLRRWLTEQCQAKERGAIRAMARRFTALSLELVGQVWAHGDLKPENLIVTPSGELRLIDFDSAFIPELAGNLSVELGTPGFQHPLRDARFYNRHLDDYSLALIGTALYALAEFPEGFDAAEDEKLLFDPQEAVRGQCEALHRIKAHWVDSGQSALYQLAARLSWPAPEIPDLPDVLQQIAEAQERTGKLSAVSTDINKDTYADTPELYRQNGFYGYRSPQGEHLTEAIYDDGHPFGEGLALVRLGKKYTYIDRRGVKRIDASAYDEAKSFSGGRAAVRKGEKWGYIDLTGRAVVAPAFDRCRPFCEGLAAVQRQGGKWGYIDPTGSPVIAPAFEHAFDFREGAAVVAQNDRFGYIDPRGKWLVEPVYAFAFGFRNGRAMAETAGTPGVPAQSVVLHKQGGRIIRTVSPVLPYLPPPKCPENRLKAA
jgi:hypothetical protein